MDYVMPNHAQVDHGLRALRTVALADGELRDAERAMLESVQQVMGTAFDVDALAPITPEELAEAIPDPRMRWQLVAALIIMSLIDQDADGREAAQVESFARAFEVDERSVHNLRQLAEKHTLRVRFDVLRRFWAVDKIRQRIREEGLRVLWETVRSLAGGSSAELAAKYRALGELPPGTLGRGYYEYMIENQFPFPGEKGAAPETILFHDLTHVLSGYGTAPDEEIQVACFSAGYRNKEPLAFVLFVMLQFHLGLPIGPRVPTEHGKFDPAKALVALRRGAAMNIDLTESWNYWEVIEEPIDSLRERYGIPPREPA